MTAERPLKVPSLIATELTPLLKASASVERETMREPDTRTRHQRLRDAVTPFSADVWLDAPWYGRLYLIIKVSPAHCFLHFPFNLPSLCNTIRIPTFWHCWKLRRGTSKFSCED